MKKTIALLACLPMIFCCSCKNLVQPLPEEASSYEQNIIYSYRGDTLDRNGSFLAGFKYMEDGSAKRVFAPDMPFSMSNILGNLGSEQWGIDYEFDDLLRVKSTNQEDANTGITIRTTLNSNLQQKVYDTISQHYSEFKGSVVIMRQNGEILADVSYPSFNHLEFDKNAEIIEQSDGFKGRNRSFVSKPLHMRILNLIPGLSEKPENVLSDIHFYDSEYLDCDFGCLEENHIDKENNSVGFMKVSPIYLAALLRKALIEDAVMPKPFMLLDFSDPDDHSIKLSDEEIISKLEDKGIDASKIERCKRRLEQRRTSIDITLDPALFKEDAFSASKYCFTPKIDESRFKFAGKSETEKSDCFWLYGMLLDSQEPNNSLIIVSANTAGIKDQEEMKILFQLLIDDVISSDPV
ncbi:MAG: hypothetical protein K5979_12415 [Ruminococcus sp.]|nr:hypothetical protein [Ruminococcus sp.]